MFGEILSPPNCLGKRNFSQNQAVKNQLQKSNFYALQKLQPGLSLRNSITSFLTAEFVGAEINENALSSSQYNKIISPSVVAGNKSQFSYSIVSIRMLKKINRSASAKQGDNIFYQTPELRTQIVNQNGRQVETCSIGKYVYSKEDLLGEGFSSRVYRCTLADNRKERYAMKVIDLSKFRPNEIELLEAEIQILCSLKHPHIIGCVDVFKTDRNYFLVTEYCPHGDLEELIKIQKSISEDKAIPIMAQILDAYKHLLSNNIIHRDLKPANIMRFGNVWKIGDFGFAKYCKEEYTLESLHVGTPLYMPPECVQANKYSARSDIFALGAIFYEMLTGETPWQGKDEKELLQAMKTMKLQVPNGIVSEQVKQFLHKSLEIDYYTRMNKQEFNAFTLDNIDIERVARIRPGRGLSSSVKKQLSKSGKKSIIFSTPNKSITRPLFERSSNMNSTNAGSTANNGQKKVLPSLQQLLFKQMLENPLEKKIYQENSAIIANQLEFCKKMVSLANQCHFLGLSIPDQQFVYLTMYRLAVKLLKMAANTRQNTYKLGAWDNFKKSEDYRLCLSQVGLFASKFEAQFTPIEAKMKQNIVRDFNAEFPELQGQPVLSYKVFCRVYMKLLKFIQDSFLTIAQKMSEEPNPKFISNSRHLLTVMTILRGRIKREQEMLGFGIKNFPTLGSDKPEALRQVLQDLQTLCREPIQLQ